MIDEVTRKNIRLIYLVHAQGNPPLLRQEVSRKLKEIGNFACFAADEFRTEQAGRIIQSIEQNHKSGQNILGLSARFGKPGSIRNAEVVRERADAP